MKYLLKVVRISYEKHNENSLKYLLKVVSISYEKRNEIAWNRRSLLSPTDSCRIPEDSWGFLHNPRTEYWLMCQPIFSVLWGYIPEDWRQSWGLSDRTSPGIDVYEVSHMTNTHVLGYIMWHDTSTCTCLFNVTFLFSTVDHSAVNGDDVREGTIVVSPLVTSVWMGWGCVHGTMVTSSPPAVTSVSSATCSLGPITFAFPFKLPGPLVSLVPAEVELHNRWAAMLWSRGTKTLFRWISWVSGECGLRGATGSSPTSTPPQTCHVTY